MKNMRKKILHISNYYVPHIGGTEITCQYLAEGSKERYDVKVICFSESQKDKVETINGITVYKAGVSVNIARQSLSLSYYRILREIIVTWKPDLIHFHYPNPFVTALLLPLLPKQTKLYLHWHLDVTTQKKIYPFIKPLERRLLKRANMIVTTSPDYKESSKPLQDFIHKVKILPSAIDISKFNLNDDDIHAIDKIRKRYDERKIVFYAGRHVLHKGVHLLLDAATYLENDCTIYIAGNGTITKDIKQQCGLKNVIFLDRLDNDELKHYYYAADIFAFPSYTRSEAFGLVLAEAMYCKTAAVTFTIKGSGVNWVCLNGVTGIEVENSNIREYAKAIDELLSDDFLRNRYAENGRVRVINEFTIEKEICILMSHYNSLLSI
jgi:glycosyltransferase involved in cell wall biosynthesis